MQTDTTNRNEDGAPLNIEEGLTGSPVPWWKQRRVKFVTAAFVIVATLTIAIALSMSHLSRNEPAANTVVTVIVSSNAPSQSFPPSRYPTIKPSNISSGSGTCGDGNQGDGICSDGRCCSQLGFCGTTPAYCFESISTPTPPTTITINAEVSNTTGCSGSGTTNPSSPTPSSPPTAGPPENHDGYCGVASCTHRVWDTIATDGGGSHSCGSRITWLKSAKDFSEHQACTQVAAEFPDICLCNPDTDDSSPVTDGISPDTDDISPDTDDSSGCCGWNGSCGDDWWCNSSKSNCEGACSGEWTGD